MSKFMSRMVAAGLKLVIAVGAGCTVATPAPLVAGPAVAAVASWSRRASP